MPQCSQCGRELASNAQDSVCNECRKRDFAQKAEQSAAIDSQGHFVITNLLLAINIAVFILMAIKKAPWGSANTDPLIAWGANFGPLTMGGQAWRILTNIFVHIGIFHLVANMWALLVLGRIAESIYGRISFLTLYLITGLMGSLGSLLWHPLVVSAGASGALCGILGALITTLIAGKLPFPKSSVRHILWTLLAWGALTIGYGFWRQGVDNAAHVGGLLSGLAIGYPLGRHLGSDRKSGEYRERILIVALIAIAVLSSITWTKQGDLSQLQRAQDLMRQNRPDEVIKVLEPLLRKRPNEPIIHQVLGAAYLRKNDFARAEIEYKQVLNSNPKNATGWTGLADVYVLEKKFPDAASAFMKAGDLQTKDNGYAYMRAGLMYQQSDRPQDAVAAFQKAVQRNQFLADAWGAMGLSLLNLKKPQEAVQALQRAVQLNPNSMDAHLWLGNAYLGIGKERESQAEFLKAYQLRAMQQRLIQQQQQLRQKQGQSAQPMKPSPSPAPANK